MVGAWMAAAALVSLALPVVALAIWGRHKGVREALLPYVFVLAVQISVEIFFARIFFPNIVVLTGITFTLYRLGQLARARRAFAATGGPGAYGRAIVGSLLSLGVVFWSANLVFLVLVALPRALQLA
jgi:hypothetical protein